MKKDFEISADWHWTINSWMIQDLHLSGLPLNIFAILYGCQKNKSYKAYEKSFLAKLTGASSEGVRKALKKLCSLGLIETRKSFSCFGERTEIKVVYKHKNKKVKKAKNISSPHQQSWQPPTNKVGTHLINKEINKNISIQSNEVNELTESERDALERLKRSAVNRNSLYKAEAMYKALLKQGYTTDEIETCWKEHQQTLQNQSRNSYFFTALWKWLDPNSERHDCATNAIQKRRNHQQALRQKARQKQAIHNAEKIQQIEEKILNERSQYRELKQEVIVLAHKVIRDRSLETEFYRLNNQLASLRSSILSSVNYSIAAQ